MRKEFKIINILIFVTILCLTIGYSAFVDELSVTNTVAHVIADPKTLVTNVTTSSGYVSNLDNSNTSIKNAANIPSGSSVTYEVTIATLGNVPMALSNVSVTDGTNVLTNVTNNINNYIKICNANDVCISDISKTIDITITNNGASSINTENLNINLTFTPFYTITYNNAIIGDVLSGGTFEYTLDSNTTSVTKTQGTGTLDDSSLPDITITGVGSDIVLTGTTSSGGGVGTPESPYEDNDTQTYDPSNVPANSTIVYTAVDGAPQVSTDANGKITSFEFTDVSPSDPITITSSDTVATGFIPFDGSSDWELNMRYTWVWSDNVGTGGTSTVTLSCMDWNSGNLISGFGIRHYAAKKTSSETTPKTNLRLPRSINGASDTQYLFNTTQNGRIYTDPMDLTVNITKVGSTVTFSITANGSFKYNPTTDNSTSGAITTTNETVTKTWQDNSSSSNVDIRIGGYVGSNGEVTQKAKINVLEFSVHKITSS